MRSYFRFAKVTNPVAAAQVSRMRTLIATRYVIPDEDVDPACRLTSCITTRLRRQSPRLARGPPMPDLAKLAATEAAGAGHEPLGQIYSRCGRAMGAGMAGAADGSQGAGTQMQQLIPGD